MKLKRVPYVELVRHFESARSTEEAIRKGRLRLGGWVAPLAARAPGVHEVIAFGDPVPHFDFHVPICSLPHRLRLGAASELQSAPYLQPSSATREVWRQRLMANSPSQSGLRVGLCFSGKSTHSEDAQRSMSLELCRPLLVEFGSRVTWVRVQPGHSDTIPGMVCIDRDVQEFLDLAGLVANLDLLITVDSAPVHLAGAMGVPTWLLNRRFGDWRWPSRRTDNDWYASVRVFHQREAGDWQAPMRQVAAALSRMLMHAA